MASLRCLSSTIAPFEWIVIPTAAEGSLVEDEMSPLRLSGFGRHDRMVIRCLRSAFQAPVDMTEWCDEMSPLRLSGFGRHDRMV